MRDSAHIERGGQREDGRRLLSRLGSLSAHREGVLPEEAFHTMLTLERRRAERSRKPFVLMLLDSHAIHKNGSRANVLQRLTTTVCNATRETDVIGWYEEGEILAVIFTEINIEGENFVTEVLHSKVTNALRENLDPTLASNLVITVHLFPETCDKDRTGRGTDIKLYPELSVRASKKRLPMVVKRAIDIFGSGLLLLILSPVLAAIALAIKLTSEGPAIFQQERLGRFGKKFKILKFRTMYVNNDHGIHREYVRRLIKGNAAHSKDSETQSGV